MSDLRTALAELLDDYIATNGPDGYPQPMPSSWRTVSDYLAATPEPTLDAAWDTDLTYEETTRLARAISQADHVNWPSRVVAEKIAGTVRAIAAARLHERTASQEGEPNA